jgi:hypothetical protein
MVYIGFASPRHLPTCPQGAHPQPERQAVGSRGVWGGIRRVCAEPSTAADAFQRPLRSRFQARLSAGVRRQKDYWDLQSHAKHVTLLCVVSPDIDTLGCL